MLQVSNTTVNITENCINTVYCSQAIYPDFMSETSQAGRWTFEILVELSEPCRIAVTEHTSPEDEVTISFLPPILMDVQLPEDYPLHAPPHIISIRATHDWLSEYKKMSESLLAMWTPGEPVIATWIEWICSATFLDELDISDAIDGSRVMRYVGHLLFYAWRTGILIQI